MNNKLKVLDLFSGIGGFSLGLHSTGIFDTIKFVEFDKYCQKVLNKNFPNIPIEGDIRNVKGTEFEADVITGGFPCQPFSVAGKQKGTNDNRYLWPEMFRLIKEIKPEFVIGENVQGIINLQDGMVLRQVLNDLEGEGFEVQCFLIPASGIGAWHQRYRVWIVGHSQHNGLLAAEKRCRDEKDYGGSQKGQNETVKLTRTSGSRDDEDVPNTNTRLSIGENEEIQARRETIDSSSSRGGEENVSDTEVIRTREPRNINQEKRNESGGSTQSNSSSKDVSNTNSGLRGGGRTIPLGGENKVWRFRVEEEGIRDNVRIETVGRNAVSREDVSNTNTKGLEGHGIQSDNEQQQSETTSTSSTETQQTWWQIESNLCGVPNGISYELDKDRANRIKTLGNAIVPQIAREFGLAIKKVLSDSDSDGQGGQQF